MPNDPIYVLGADDITISGGLSLSGETQGTGQHLNGATITLNSNSWTAIDITDSEDSFDDSDNSQTLDPGQSLDGTAYGGGLRVEAEYELTLRDGDGNEYTVLGFNINEPGSPFQSYGTVEGLAFVGGVGGFPPVGEPLTVVGNAEGPSYDYSALATPPCFCAGTLIGTPAGPRAVETLRAGDLVDTLDHGPRPLRWVGTCRLPAAALAREPRFRPVRIAPGALGPGMPARALSVSPQHRILIRDWRAALFFGEPEVLVAARKLVNGTDITRDDDAQAVSYHHLLFDRHELVWSNGLLTESYLPGAEADPAATEARALFPDLARAPLATARPCAAGGPSGVFAARV